MTIHLDIILLQDLGHVQRLKGEQQLRNATLK
jgi:hypothetical protein